MDITILEGVDGTGKTTFAQELCDKVTQSIIKRPFPRNYKRLNRKEAINNYYKMREIGLDDERDFVKLYNHLSGDKDILEIGNGFIMDRSFISGIVYSINAHLITYDFSFLQLFRPTKNNDKWYDYLSEINNAIENITDKLLQDYLDISGHIYKQHNIKLYYMRKIYDKTKSDNIEKNNKQEMLSYIYAIVIRRILETYTYKNIKLIEVYGKKKCKDINVIFN